MGQASFSSTLTLSELESSYSLYFKALRILIREGKSVEKINRSVCWLRLAELHRFLPRKYKSPEHLYVQIKSDINT
jgi:hypothetical protein